MSCFHFHRVPLTQLAYPSLSALCYSTTRCSVLATELWSYPSSFLLCSSLEENTWQRSRDKLKSQKLRCCLWFLLHFQLLLSRWISHLKVFGNVLLHNLRVLSFLQHKYDPASDEWFEDEEESQVKWLLDIVANMYLHLRCILSFVQDQDPKERKFYTFPSISLRLSHSEHLLPVYRILTTHTAQIHQFHYHKLQLHTITGLNKVNRIKNQKVTINSFAWSLLSFNFMCFRCIEVIAWFIP